MPDISGTPNSKRAGYPLDTLGWPKLPRKQSPARRDGAWKVGGSNYEIIQRLQSNLADGFCGSEALRLTRVAELAA